MTVLCAVATYNEIENLPRLVDAIFAAAPQCDILVVDDNSPDGTGAWCDERAAKEPRLTCLHREGKLGLGSATIAAMRHAIECDYDIVATMDADFSHDPAVLPKLIAAVESGEADVAIGSRYCEGGAIDGWPLRRRVASRMVNAYSRKLLGLTPRDCSGAFRAYSVEILKAIDLSKIQSAGYAYLEEILVHLTRAGARFQEIPITFRDRESGASKLGVREAARTLATIARLARMKE